MEQPKFYRKEEVMEMLSIGQTKALEIIKDLNKELKEQGYYTFAGRVSSKYFQQRFGIYQD